MLAWLRRYTRHHTETTLWEVPVTTLSITPIEELIQQATQGDRAAIAELHRLQKRITSVLSDVYCQLGIDYWKVQNEPQETETLVLQE